MRGLKPWEQFYNYCDGLSNTEGTWLQSAKARDKRNLGRWQQLWEEMQRNPRKSRPPAVGFTGLRAEIHGLRNDIRAAFHMAPLDGPATPIDDIKDNQRVISDRALDRALGYTDD